MENYIHFEVEEHKPWARNHLIGIYLDDKGREKRHRLMCFNHCVSMEENNKMIQDLCEYYNAKFEIKRAMGTI